MEMKKKFMFEVGDPNYVKPGEYFVQLTPDGSAIDTIYKRMDDLSLVAVTSPTLSLEDKTVTYSIAELTAGDVTINPTDGKDAMSKVVITFTE